MRRSGARHGIVMMACRVMAVCGAAITFLGAVDAAGATTPAYVTPIMAHTAWTATENCRPVAGVATLPTVLSGHSSRGLSLTGTIVTSWIAETTRTCIEPMALSPFPKPIQMPSWADLKTYRAKYPAFDLASASRDYKEMTSLTVAQQKAEACDSKNALVAHGVTAPIPLFAYPNNKYTAAMNTMVRTQCSYRLGRRYSGAENTSTTVRSGFLNVYSINGGHCTDTTLPCSDLMTRYPYTPKSTLSAYVHPAAGGWVVPQFYRLVNGSKTSGRLRWNCLGAMSSHYTFDTGGDSSELYCANDYYGAFANERSYVKTGLTVRQVETLWGVP
jgi:hypothetical protein